MNDPVSAVPSGQVQPLHDRQVRSRREILIGCACLTTATVAFVREPRRHVAYLGSGKLEHLVPTHFAGWEFATASGLVLPPEDQLKDQLYSQLLTRTYTGAGGNEIMLLIAYNGAQDGVVQIHRPEVCYPASGFQLTENRDHSIQLSQDIVVPSRFILAENPVRREKIVYWTRVGTDFPRKWSEQRLSVFEQNLHGVIPDGLLVRISSVSQDIGADVLDQFARDLFTNAGQTMQMVLGGKHI
jgi:EpsI family protein